MTNIGSFDLFLFEGNENGKTIFIELGKILIDPVIP